MHAVRTGGAILATVFCAVGLNGCQRAETPTATTPPTSEVAPPIESAAIGSTAAIATIEAALANDSRLADDRAQDGERKSKDVLTFLGVKPGMRVIDYFSAGGYNTELLSYIVGPQGQVIAFNNLPYLQFAGKKPAERYGNNRLANVAQLTTPPEDLALEPSSLDAALFVLSYHDLHWRAKDNSWPKTDPSASLQKLFAALKPGAAIVVVDHVANPGGDTGEVVDSLHRIDPAVIKRDFEAAGFTFDDEANFLRNPQDDHTKPVLDESIKGKTDRVVYRFLKK